MYGSLVKLCGIPRILVAVVVILLLFLSCMTRAVPLRSLRSGGQRHVTVVEGAGTLVMLRNTRSERLVQIRPGVRGRPVIDALGLGDVRTNRSNKFAMLLMKSAGDFGYVEIISNLTKEYLCFSANGKVVMRATPQKYCVFKEHERIRRGETVFRYSVEVPVRSAPGTSQTLYLGFKKNGKKLRGNQWEDSRKFEVCTYFSKEKELVSIESVQDPNAPSVDLREHWEKHSEERSRSRETDLNHKEAPNDNAPWAPQLHNQKIVKSKSNRNINRNGRRVRHRERKLQEIT